MYDSLANMAIKWWVLLLVTLNGSMLLSFNIISFVFNSHTCLSFWYLKANLGYIDTGLKKGGKNGELSQFLTATPNSAEYYNNLFQLPTQSITKL